MTTSVFQAASAGTGKDAYIDSSATTTNFGTANPLFCGEQTGKLARLFIVLMGFDISAIPAGDVISAATREFNVTAVVNPQTYSPGDPVTDAVVTQLLRRVDWVSAQATYAIYKTANNWGTAGANSPATDFYKDFGGADVDQFWEMPQATGAFALTYNANGIAQLQYALDNLSGIYGVRDVLQPAIGSNVTFSISSDDDATLANRPKLIVEHAPPSTSQRRRGGIR